MMFEADELNMSAESESPPTGHAMAAEREAPLRRTFFIHDTSACQREEDPPEDMVLYFYPPETPIDRQSMLMGAVHALIAFAQKFSSTPAYIIRMEREKMAYKHIAPYTIALCGHSNESDTALINQLECLYGAFRFFHGSFQRVLKRCNNDHRQFLAEMKVICAHLVHLVLPSENVIHGAFEPLPFTDLPPHSSRYFLMGSQLLQKIKRFLGALAGCVLHENSVLCGHFPPEIVHWVLARKEKVGFGATDISQASPFLSSSPSPTVTVSSPAVRSNVIPISSSVPISADSRLTDRLSSSVVSPAAPASGVTTNGGMAVYITAEQSKFLRRDCAKGVRSIGVDLLKRIPTEYLHHKASKAEGEYVGLYVRKCGAITLVMIVELYFLYDERTLEKLREAVDESVRQLDRNLATCFREHPIRDTHEQPNHLVFDANTKSLRGNLLDPQAPIHNVFMSSVGVVHDIFATDPDISQIVLADSEASLLSRRSFGLETYYQQPANIYGGRSAFRPVAKLEDQAAEFLTSEYFVTMS